MKKQLLWFVVMFTLFFLFSGCQGESGKSESSFPEKTEDYSEWNTDVPFALYVGTTTENSVNVTLNGTYTAEDQETLGKKCAAHIDKPEELEAIFAEHEMRWVTCEVDIRLTDSVEETGYSMYDVAFLCSFGRYEKGEIQGISYYNANSSSKMTTWSDDWAAAITFERSVDFLSCKATVYACIPADDDTFSVQIIRCVGEEHNFTYPDISDNLVCAWEFPKLP